MKVSIVIPALNEAELLPSLLESIKVQDFSDYEVIVADAGSTDGTRRIAEEYGCLVVEGGLPGAGRNAGAREAKGDYLFFLDADVQLPPGFIGNIYREMEERFIDVATCAIRPLSDYQLDRIIHDLINTVILMNLRMDPKAFGFCIFVTRQLFNRIGGFDETIKVAEDNDFVKRAARFRPLRYLHDSHILVSVRRFEKEGRFAYMAKGVRLNLHRAFKGEIREDGIVEYEFDAFDKPVPGEQRRLYDRVEQRLLNLEDRLKKSGARRIGEIDPAEENRSFRRNLTAFQDLLKELAAIKREEDT